MVRWASSLWNSRLPSCSEAAGRESWWWQIYWDKSPLKILSYRRPWSRWRISRLLAYAAAAWSVVVSTGIESVEPTLVTFAVSSIWCCYRLSDFAANLGAAGWSGVAIYSTW